MATRNSLFTRLALSAAFIAALGCQSAQQKLEPTPTTPTESAQPHHPAVNLPPTPPPSAPKKVAVILGAGGAKALAHIGVLRALQQQRIPIDKVIGLEWGALIGGMYARQGQVNDIEWKLYRMEQKGLPRPKGFFAKKLGEDSIKIMDDYFKDTFLNEDVANAHIPFECPTRSIWSGVVAWQNRGLYRDVMKRCVPFPPLFKTQGTFLAGASQASEAVERLRAEGYNVIILVDVLGSAMPVDQDGLVDNMEFVVLWQEVKRELLETEKSGIEFINVDTSAIPLVQFESKKELIGLGEAAGMKAAGALISKYGF